LSEALKWYGKAAEQGDTAARFTLAQMYLEGRGVEKNFSEAARWYGCPPPNVRALETCKQTTYEDLPEGALELLRKLKCDVNPKYAYGSAVDLNGDGEPEYQVCCYETPHGACGAVVIGKVASAWKNLTAKEGVAGYEPACGLFVVLASQHNGFSDVCLPNQCSIVSPPAGNACVPTIWNLINRRYQTVKYTPPASRK
jgi:hypothetical protein